VRLKILRKQLRGPLTWLTMISGVGYIIVFSGAACEGVMRVWPNWGGVICGALAVNAVFLSWLWCKRVRKAAEDGEFD
jgi:hypothetical protein